MPSDGTVWPTAATEITAGWRLPSPRHGDEREDRCADRRHVGARRHPRSDEHRASVPKPPFTVASDPGRRSVVWRLMTANRSMLVGAAFGAGALVGRASASPQLRFARMTGSSIAGTDAAGWITDFLNAAYYRRDPASREVEDLRLASAIVT